MAYATVTDMIATFSEREMLAVSNVDYPTATTINEDVVNRAIADSDAEIDSYLGVRYAVPLTTTIPARITSICCDLARHRLDRNRPREEVVQRRDRALFFLKDIAAGRATLPELDLLNNSSSQKDTAYYFSGGRRWTQNSLSDY